MFTQSKKIYKIKLIKISPLSKVKAKRKINKKVKSIKWYVQTKDPRCNLGYTDGKASLYSS